MRKPGIDEILRELTALRRQIESLSEEETAGRHGPKEGGIPDLCNPLPPYARGTDAAGSFRPTPFGTRKAAH